MVEDADLQQRLERARLTVAEQRQRLRASRLRLREIEAAASARSDRATAGLLRSRGYPSPAPPVPPHPPDWLEPPPPEP
ncbi:MAG: hypothetical protein AVDCRST_MAG16-3302 [uncultured Frankineae bacterium]|uniref:Uncharacterized protein n=1 Tax=uncultured Frankineae bacterium TaxID=437475 RepID=A0A6J4MPR2_9ACTN|nr:MAG: hypothetical protein AVDCRST_MAG16-3302 [uncultured Frankineae bacterium]